MFNESDDRETKRNKSHAEEIRVPYNCSSDSDKLGRLVLLRLLHTYGCTIYARFGERHPSFVICIPYAMLEEFNSLYWKSN